ncbi:MAG TPA: malto-oligosyltrehalose synthase [Thermodesulfovibrionales bacterium]|nr:malto-oligosyltrehalose synthase [Thermodesulfovibrionales bacterium]
MKKEALLMPRIPVSTYRLQFNQYFRFTDAKTVVPYLHELGISDVYASPYFKAREGSLHGYDIVDPNVLNPEIGTEEEYHAFISELRTYKMGQMLDIVPNHMCIQSKDNAWWMNILENGRSSIYAEYFDIDWNPVKKELKNKVLLPILGDHYGRVLESQELRLEFREGTFLITYHDHVLPVRPKTYGMILIRNIEVLKTELREERPDLEELLSILTAFKNLPAHTVRDMQKIQERNRKKEVIKQRLWELCKKSQDIRDFIDKNLIVFNGTKGDPKSFELLDSLLNEQVYRLSFWRVAAEEINYRRFFDINDYAAIRMENRIVFQSWHRRVFALIRKGYVTGLRVDHPDGLHNPLEYFQRLQRNCFLQLRLSYLKGVQNSIPEDLLENVKDEIPSFDDTDSALQDIAGTYDEIQLSDPDYKPFYIVGEKILIKDERMPKDWPIFSTTGYVFLNTLNGIFIRAENAKSITDIYERFTKMRVNFQDIVYEKKKLIMEVAMSSEINTLGHHLNKLSEKNRHTRDFTLKSLTAVIIEVVAFFPVYRTYITQGDVDDWDQRYIEFAVSKAKRKNTAISGSIFDFLKDILLLHYPEYFEESDKREWIDFVMRFQQLTGPVMAKGIEDTVCYVYNRFISLNEVGGSPDRFGTSLETFHGKNIERLKCWPHALIATSTHDTKRSEDVRSRMNVLSEIPDEWRKCLISWKKMNKKKKPLVDGQRVPDANEEYHLYQTLIGVWPPGEIHEDEYESLVKRIKDYMLKAIREAKVNTSWINPNSLYEDACVIFIDLILSTVSDNQFLKEFSMFKEKISWYGMFNSLSQVLLKITSPGVPDFYQGTELWNFSLVDPDNRQPVDYRQRMEMLNYIRRREKEIPLSALARSLTVDTEDGMVKLYLIYKALCYRSEKRELFERGEYLPLEVMGEKAENVCAFARRIGNERAIIAVPRFFASLIMQSKGLPLGKEVWGDSRLIVSIADHGARYRNIFTDEIITAEEDNDATTLRLSEVFSHFPVAMIERQY